MTLHLFVRSMTMCAATIAWMSTVYTCQVSTVSDQIGSTLVQKTYWLHGRVLNKCTIQGK